jgi:hypothetical protein
MASIKDFINFDYFITKDVIAAIYILGTIFITLVGIVIIVWGQVLPYGAYKDASSAIISGGLFLIFGNFIWRIICEFTAVIFKINDSLISINTSLKKQE